MLGEVAMPITFACRSCGKELEFGNEAAGEAARCPLCKAAIRVPGPDDSIFWMWGLFVAVVSCGAVAGVVSQSMQAALLAAGAVLVIAWNIWLVYLLFKFNRCMNAFLKRDRDKAD